MTYENTEAELKLKVCRKMPARQRLLESRGAISGKQLDMCSDTPNGELGGNESIKAWLSCRVRVKENELEP